MDSATLIKIAQDLLQQDPKHRGEAARFNKVSLGSASVVVLENERTNAVYKVVLDTTTGKFVFSSYQAPSA